MTAGVQITLIICITIVAVCLIGNKSNKKK